MLAQWIALTSRIVGPAVNEVATIETLLEYAGLPDSVSAGSSPQRCQLSIQLEPLGAHFLTRSA